MTSAIGIDLGTSYSCVGHFKTNKVNIIENDHGNRTTPSFVAFNKKGTLVGDTAQQQSAMNPQNTVYDAKRLIGRKFNDAEVQQDCKHYSFKVMDKEGEPVVEVEVEGAIKQLRPEEISSMVLAKMKTTAQDSLGVPIKDAVVTVPAYFNNQQRELTKKAGELAGLNVLEILNEPTAAALAYSLDLPADKKNILVFDLGGGTFDVSVVEHVGTTLKVLATAGDTHLGGEDFDSRLVAHFVQVFKDENGEDISGNFRAMRRLRAACERTKRKLSFQKEASIEIDCLHAGIDLYTTIEREEFESMCGDLFEGTLKHIKQVLDDAKLEKKQIDEVVLVGGSSRIPKVRELLSELFDGKTLNCGINPDEAVATGAAIRAATLSNDLSEMIQKLKLQDVCSLSVGVRVSGEIMSVVFPRNTPLPARKSEGFNTVCNNQKSILFSVYEGERLLVKDNRLLGSFKIVDLPSLPAREAEVEVLFELDNNGILKIRATDKSNRANIAKAIVKGVDTAGADSDKTQIFVQDALKFKKQDEEEVSRIRLMENAKFYLERIDSKIENNILGIPPAEVKESRKLVAKLRDWLQSNKDVCTQDEINQRRALCEESMPDILEFKGLPLRIDTSSVVVEVPHTDDQTHFVTLENYGNEPLQYIITTSQSLPYFEFGHVQGTIRGHSKIDLEVSHLEEYSNRSCRAKDHEFTVVAGYFASNYGKRWKTNKSQEDNQILEGKWGAFSQTIDIVYKWDKKRQRARPGEHSAGWGSGW